MGGDGYRLGKQPKSVAAIRACAGLILENLHDQTIVLNLKAFSAATIRDAYRLLIFEQLIRRHSGYALTSYGQRHVEKLGPKVYEKGRFGN